MRARSPKLLFVGRLRCLAPDDKERKTEPKSREGKTRGWEAPVLHWNPKYFTALRTEHS